jgi:hypothetical protein
MFLEDDQLDRYVGKGAEFEKMLHALIRAEAVACGIPPHEIDWDFRVHVRDGGRDVLVRSGNDSGLRKFIPAITSVWSAKSGKDGLSASSLHKEIEEHPQLLKHLQNGGAYVWCALAAADTATRDNLRGEAARISEQLSLKPGQFLFFFRDTISLWLNQHIGVASVFFDLPRGWKTLDEWRRRDKNFDVPWVSFGTRSESLTTIQRHLLSRSAPNVLHVAGWSGIGKTRTVLEACLQEVALEGTLYFPRFEDFTNSEDYLLRNEGLRAAVVIDEVERAQSNDLRSRLAHCEERIRIVTIGPALAHDFQVSEDAIAFPAPSDEGGVQVVIRAADPKIDGDQLFNIASFADHDLRLALILVEANQRDPWLTNLPASLADVWRIILSRFKAEIGDLEKFRELYDLLCSCKDVGNKGEPRHELEYLARYFGKPITDFDHVIAQAVACGLARQQGRYVEVQRGLGRYRFATATWPRLASTASDFVSEMPTLRMQERFIDRAHECNANLREEIAASLNPWFIKRFPSVKIDLVQDRYSARLFAAYTELNPTFGLHWLHTAVNKATSEELLAFDARSDGSGFWRGRRNIVWLCEHLGQFPEHFWTCEAILYRLALHENEEGTANNSRGVWQRLFRPMFSWTAVPFEERFDHVMTKLKAADVHNQVLVLEAAMGAVFEQIGETALPKIVGGRPVPQEWKPATFAELHQIRAASAARIIDCGSATDSALASCIRSRVIEQLGTFLSLGCISKLQEWLDPKELGEASLRELRNNLDDCINLMEVRAEGSDWLDVHPTEAEKTQARTLRSTACQWQREIAPDDLASRIREVTARHFGQHNSFSRSASSETEALYTSLSLATISNSIVIDELIDWFDSGEAHSGGEFGRVLGRTDNAFVLFPCILATLVKGRGTEFVGGYLFGIRTLFGALPTELSEILDLVGESHAAHILAITLRCDVSDAGFKRLLRVAPHVGQNASLSLSTLAYGHWGNLLNDEMKAETVELLSSLGQYGDSYAYGVALDLILHWGHQEWTELPEPLATHAMSVLDGCLTGNQRFRSHEWLHAIRKLPATYEQRRLELLARVTTETRLDLDIHLTDGALDLLNQLAGKTPQSVMEAIGGKALDPKTRSVFFYQNFRGLFETIGLDVVKEWLARAGSDGALAIARHVLSPMPTMADPTQIPPLTEWLLSEFEDNDDVFAEFCAGRHSGQIFFGSLSGPFEGTEERMQPYLTHRLRRIREWAQYEIANAKGMRAWDIQREAEFGRV